MPRRLLARDATWPVRLTDRAIGSWRVAVTDSRTSVTNALLHPPYRQRIELMAVARERGRR